MESESSDGKAFWKKVAACMSVSPVDGSFSLEHGKTWQLDMDTASEQQPAFQQQSPDRSLDYLLRELGPLLHVHSIGQCLLCPGPAHAPRDASVVLWQIGENGSQNVAWQAAPVHSDNSICTPDEP